MAGALLGSFAYALAYEPLKPILIDPLSFGKVTLPDVLGLSPFLVGYVVAALIIGVVLFLDKKERQDGVMDEKASTFVPPSTSVQN